MNPNIPVPTRDRLVDLLPHGVMFGVELGVAEGEFSEQLLRRNRSLHLYCVDRWNDHHDDAERNRAALRLAQFGERAKIMWSTFADAVRAFPDETFDFIYIDGYAHTGQEGGATLYEWWPKLRSGGMFAGHDYDEEKWPATFHAVNAFLAELRSRVPVSQASEPWPAMLPERPNVTTHDQYPSWWIVKP